MKNFFMIFIFILIFSVSGCWNNAYPKPEAFNDTDETESVSDNDTDESEDSELLPDNDNVNDTDNNIVSDEDIFIVLCEHNHCIGIEHSTEECFAGNGSYRCGCEGEYFWYDSACILDPCDMNKCGEIEDSAGECIPKGHDYICKCEDDFFWYESTNTSTCILSSCRGNPCSGKENSSGECVPLTSDKYECKCIENYYWNENACIPSPCKSDSCSKIENATGECIVINQNQYSCSCKNGYFWNGEECTSMPECSKKSGNPCKDSSTGLIWSSMQLTSLYNASCKNEGGFYDWHVPSIGELRSLIVGCPGTMLGGSCGVDTQCKNSDCYTEGCQSCDYSSDGRYSKLGDTELLLSFSMDEETYLWIAAFSSGGIGRTQCPAFLNIEVNYNCEPESKFRCARCEEGYLWEKDKCVKSPCTQKSCDIPHSDPGWCVPESGTTFRCKCKKDYVWNGSECILNPCFYKPCKEIPHADPDRCYYNNEMTFQCQCDKNYIWNGSACAPSKCLEEPCKDIPHAYNICTPLGEDKYSCACIESFEWGAESYAWDGEKCVSPCDSKPCEIPNSDGICDVQTAEIYICGCKYPYYWDKNSRKCVNLCDDNPCSKDEHSTGQCYSKYGPDYTCECVGNYYWGASSKKCLPN